MNLFITRTPLQAVISEKIIKKEVAQEYEVFYVAPSNSQSQVYAYESLSLLASESNFYHLKEEGRKLYNLYNHFRLFKYIKEKFKGKQYENVYLGSIDGISIHLLLSCINFKQMFTLDDGSANVTDSSYFNVKKTNIFLLNLSIIFGNKYTKEKLLSGIKTHYTITPTIKNIIENVEIIDLYDSESNSNDKKLERCNVLLGTVYSEFYKDEATLKNKIEVDFDFIDYYLPHPRECDDLFLHKQLKDDFRIAEFKILDLLNDYHSVVVYGFPSSVMIHLDAIKNIEFVVFIFEDHSLYNTIEDHSVSSIIECLTPEKVNLYKMDI